MFKLEMETDSAAFEEGPEIEIARILADLASRVEGGQSHGVIRDTNGNRVGAWEWTV